MLFESEIRYSSLGKVDTNDFFVAILAVTLPERVFKSGARG